MEFTTTRSNLMIDPHLTIWGPDLAIYLFLGGLVCGIMVLSGLYYFMKGIDEETPRFIRNSMLASPILLSIGMFFLFLDLENKWHVFRFYMTFKIGSPMSWGSWILIVIYPVTVAMIVLANRSRWWVNWYPPAERIVKPYWRAIALANVIFGTMLGLYTGVLLSNFVARPFWNNGMLAPLFLLSGISAGAAWMILFHDGSDIKEKKDLELIKLGLILSEITALLLFATSMLASVGNQKASIFMILGGPYTATFWVFVIGIGLVIPLLLQTLEILNMIESRYIMPLMVLVGGFALRLVILGAGQLSEVVK